MRYETVHRNMRVFNSVSLFAVLSCIAMIGATPVAKSPRQDDSKYVLYHCLDVIMWLTCFPSCNIIDLTVLDKVIPVKLCVGLGDHTYWAWSDHNYEKVMLDNDSYGMFMFLARAGWEKMIMSRVNCLCLSILCDLPCYPQINENTIYCILSQSCVPPSYY